MRVLSSQMKFLISTAAALLTLGAAPASFAEIPATDANARSLAAAESAFAQESVAKGVRTAFLRALSDDGIVFQPGPQNGRKAWEARKDSEGVLLWQPVLAVVAASGDLGYTTGPWTFKRPRRTSKPPPSGNSSPSGGVRPGNGNCSSISAPTIPAHAASSDSGAAREPRA